MAGLSGQPDGSRQARAKALTERKKEMDSKVGDLQSQADNKIKGMVTGESRELHEVMLAVEKANISFQFLTQVRNKAMEAYQEIMKMPV